ncbi:MAG: hypothetical protein ACFFBV_01795 [Promethearchaeota archaeon]
MKKGPICLIYYAIKNHSKAKLEQKEIVSEFEEISSQSEIYDSAQ